MDKKLFDDLVKSIEQAGKYKRGKAKPSRCITKPNKQDRSP
jgi:hypothetical protein